MEQCPSVIQPLSKELDFREKYVVATGVGIAPANLELSKKVVMKKLTVDCMFVLRVKEQGG